MSDLRADLAALRAVSDMAALTVKIIGRPDDGRDHSMATLTRRDLCLFCDAVGTSVAALARIAEIVADTDPDHGIDDNVAIDRIRAVLAGAAEGGG